MVKNIDDWVEEQELEAEERLRNGEISQREYQREIERIYHEARTELDEYRNEIEKMLNERYFD
jgi:hypothetical protein